MYPCCNGEATSDGCSVNAYHITNDVDPRGFVKTLTSDDSNKQRVYALDCEMCYTTRGIELTRITVIDDNGQVAYESFVKPDNKILDYNTRFVVSKFSKINFSTLGQKITFYPKNHIFKIAFLVKFTFLNPQYLTKIAFSKSLFS